VTQPERFMQFTDPLFLLVVLAVLIVLGILMFGVGTFGRGGDFNRRNANKIMRWRIYAQAVAIALVLLYVYLRRQGG
jgi:hypoxia induced protein